jgi:diguanylate cyclase (GGDEF)-like protein
MMGRGRVSSTRGDRATGAGSRPSAAAVQAAVGLAAASAAGQPAAAEPDAPAAAAAARTDAKTGLLNATAWQREADAEVARAQRAGSPLALLLVDVDHFKRVNDSHGHLIGDEVLRALATELRQQVRESDVVGRFGGEEFTVLLPRTDGAGAYGIAERLRANAATLSVAAADTRINVTVSIGVAVLGQHGHDPFELLTAADVALYRAKDAGRDQVRIYAHATGNATENKDEATDACP